MAWKAERADRNALALAGACGLALLAVSSAVELVPWGLRGVAPLDPMGRAVLGSADAGEILWPAFLLIAGTLAVGALAVTTLVRLPVLDWPWSRRLLVIMGLGLMVGITRSIAVSVGLPVDPPVSFKVVEAVLGWGETVGAMAIIVGYADARHRIRATERARCDEERRAARAQAEVEQEEMRVRREVSQRLHGGLQQRLVLSIGELRSIRQHLELTDERSAARAVGEVVTALEEVVDAEVRDVAHRLYPLVADIDLPGALTLLSDQLPPSVRMDVHLEEPAEALVAAGSLSPADRVTLFSIVEEGVTNAVKHGKAHAIRVVLGADLEPGAPRTAAHVAVDDDGVGVDHEPELSGLACLRARIRRRGGELGLGPSPLGGARLQAYVPVEPWSRAVVGKP